METFFPRKTLMCFSYQICTSFIAYFNAFGSLVYHSLIFKWTSCHERYPWNFSEGSHGLIEAQFLWWWEKLCYCSFYMKRRKYSTSNLLAFMRVELYLIKTGPTAPCRPPWRRTSDTTPTSPILITFRSFFYKFTQSSPCFCFWIFTTHVSRNLS